ncbi:adhesin [Pontibacillus halophilus JSM 076056 = DSM 19796]|uniref:Adhesin n=1 Tax=Pontibacillus halophilus JSM 076056 = DSM 19796 TaxID=1385510 RepID=A0A0A5GHV8_9BACI|nr:zinc ABC transporter substrate-binding protein [Pontibacillus halophilus]KGX92841.1 adhesin [Pontibacillus halophilus JSM 076056 = DSM 19796]
MKRTLMVTALSLLLAACSGNSANQSNDDEVTIYTTIYPIEFFAEEIGGEEMDVETIYPPGADAHTFEPTAKTMTKLADSDAFIYLGAGLEGFAEDAADTLQNESVKLVELGENKDMFMEMGEENDHSEHGESDEHNHDTHDGHDHHDHGGIDPHIWLDPIRSKELAAKIADTLIELNPEQEEQYEANLQNLQSKLDRLNEEFKSVVTSTEQNKMLVSHSGYGYWEDRYGIEQISISGLSPSAEPSQKELERIVEKAKEHNLSYMVFEQNVSSQTASIIQNELNAEAVTLHNLATRTEEDIEKGYDYFSIMEQNLETLEKVLSK